MRPVLIIIIVILALLFGVGVGYAVRSSGARATSGEANSQVSQPMVETDPAKMTDAGLDRYIQGTSAHIDHVRSQLEQAKKVHGRFLLNGKIADRDETSVLIYGTSSNYSPDDGSSLGTHIADSANLMIKSYDAKGVIANAYYNGDAYFVGKSEGTNQYGASVPIYLFSSTPPDDLTALQNKIEVLAKELDDAQAIQKSRAPAVSPAKSP